jgi:serine phosphatase RsbU (regulator of sigma subunit)
VLLVEDDDGDALLVEDLLAEALPAAQLRRSPSCAEAIDEVRSGIDCVLLDLNLPDASGLEALVRVRASAPEVPLIVLTGLDEEAVGTAAVDAGAQDYLVKGSVDGHQLARAIRYAIARRQVEAAQQQLRLAEIQAGEVVRLERGLAPRPFVTDRSVWIAARYNAGRDRALLGGDFFDVAETPDGHLRVLIGDVCGHGPDEAAIGVCLRAAWRALTLTGVDSDLVVPGLESVLEHEREVPALFATLCALEIEHTPSVVRMIRAGHPSPLLIDGSSVSELSSGGGPPIGITDGRWSPESVALPEAWAILLYTDGISDARVDGGSERLGEAGFRRLLADYLAARPDWHEQPDLLLAELLSQAEQLNRGALKDDVAMLLIGSQRRGPEET